MAVLRWLLGAVVLAGSVGCGSSATNGPDGGAGGGDATSPADAKGGDAMATDAGCVTGSVTFVVHVAPGSATRYCLGAPDTCSSEWLSVHAAGSDASLAIDMPCQSTCSQCQPIGCTDQCAIPSPLGDAGSSTTWDGTYYASGTCGAAAMACINPACAPAGNYVATFCGYPELPDASSLPGCTASSVPTCADTSFVWPPPAASAPVEGVLGGTAGDGG
ncbi:MAG: hypothetical protein ACLP1X_33230 [Polyangiaceae bacterium]|jgi:hypothetical protein